MEVQGNKDSAVPLPVQKPPLRHWRRRPRGFRSPSVQVQANKESDAGTTVAPATDQKSRV